MDKLDMSLEDIGKNGQSAAKGRGGRKGNVTRGRGRGGMKSQQGGGDNDSEGAYVNPLSRDNDMDVPAASWDDDRESSGPVRNRRRNARAAPYARDRNNGSRADGAWERGASVNGGGSKSSIPRVITTKSAKVLVTNLDSEVTQEDIQEIFEQAGEIKSVNMKAQGTAEVSFVKKGTAAQVVKDFDGAEVDGRPMYLRLLESAGPMVKRFNVDRSAGRPERGIYVAKRNDRSSSRGGGKDSLFGSALNGGGDFGGRRQNNPRRARQNGGRQNGGGRARQNGGRGGRGGGRQGGRAKREEKKPATAEELDADMDSYFSAKTADAPVEAATMADE